MLPTIHPHEPMRFEYCFVCISSVLLTLLFTIFSGFLFVFTSQIVKKEKKKKLEENISIMESIDMYEK